MCSCVFSLFCWLSFFFQSRPYFHRWYLHCWFFPASKQQDYVPVREVGSDFLASRRGNCIPTWGCSSCKWIYIYIYTKSILYINIYIYYYTVYIYYTIYIYKSINHSSRGPILPHIPTYGGQNSIIISILIAPGLHPSTDPL